MTRKKPGMKGVGASISSAEFKAKCLSLMDDVAKHRRPLTVTKRGRPVVRVVPLKEEERPLFGFLSGCVVGNPDLTTPTGESWEAESE
ncbi:MAG: type II toxin-antitoxin system Phd/YefM family antitoxin [Candidatus Tyrphobacter sp.]